MTKVPADSVGRCAEDSNSVWQGQTDTMFSRSLDHSYCLWNFSHGYTLPSKYGDQNLAGYFICALICALEQLPHVSVSCTTVWDYPLFLATRLLIHACVQNNMQISFCRTSGHLAAPLLHWCSGCSYSKEEALHIFLWDSILCENM